MFSPMRQVLILKVCAVAFLLSSVNFSQTYLDKCCRVLFSELHYIFVLIVCPSSHLWCSSNSERQFCLFDFYLNSVYVKSRLQVYSSISSFLLPSIAMKSFVKEMFNIPNTFWSSNTAYYLKCFFERHFTLVHVFY